MLDLNLTAPFRCLRRALPSMTSAGFGRVVVIASVAGKVGVAADRGVHREQARRPRPGPHRGGRGRAHAG